MRTIDNFVRFKNNWAVPLKEQPNISTNFLPHRTVTFWTRWKRVGMVVQSYDFSTFCTFVKSFSGFFSCFVHDYKFKWFVTGFNNCCLITTINNLETLFSLFYRSNFNCFFYSCSWSSGGFFVRDKSSCTGISYSFRCFTHDNNLY